MPQRIQTAKHNNNFSNSNKSMLLLIIYANQNKIKTKCLEKLTFLETSVIEPIKGFMTEKNKKLSTTAMKIKIVKMVTIKFTSKTTLHLRQTLQTRSDFCQLLKFKPNQVPFKRKTSLSMKNKLNKS
jgi:hypothetical protein